MIYNQTIFLDNYLLLGKIRFFQFYRIKSGIPSFNERIDKSLLGISNFNDYLDFSQIKKCRLNNETNYYYSGEILKVFKNKYTQPNNEDCSGFYWFDLNPEKDLSIIFNAYLKNIIWIDYNTEYFVIQFNGYNLNRNIIITVKLIFEQGPNGLVKTNYKVCVLNSLNLVKIFMNFEFKSNNVARIMAYLILFFYSIISLFDIINNIITNFSIYFMDFWNIFRTIKVSMFLSSSCIRIYLCLTILNKININKTDSFIDTDNLCYLEKNLLLLEALNTCSTLLYFLKFLDKNIIGPISNTLSLSLKNIFVFLTCFFCGLSGFAFFAYFIYGTRSLKYKNLSVSYLHVVYMTFGDLSDFNELLYLFPIATQFFNILIGVTFLILFNNWLIAVVMYSFSKIGLEKKKDNLVNGIVYINPLQEMGLIKNKLMRNVRLMIDNITKYYNVLIQHANPHKDLILIGQDTKEK